MVRVYLDVFLLIVYAFFCYLLLEITLQYIPYHTDVAFLRIKQDYISMWYYKLAFFIHVYTSLLILPAAFTQFSPWILKHHFRIHKLSGWLYVVVVLLLSAPSGFIIGIYANGGWSSQLAFCLLAILWFYFTLRAIQSIRKKNILLHQKMMIRSFSLALSAITLRAWKYIIVILFHTRPMDTYQLVAWLGWVLNLIIAEIIILKTVQKKK